MKSFPIKIAFQKPKKERLDLLLLERGLSTSRTKAQALILAGQVKVKGQIVTKVGALVTSEDVVELIAGQKFVSRGGEKLEGALQDFSLNPFNLICLDIGSSTGGFTDCVLKLGAKKVYAVDVGKGQLDVSLRNHDHVVVMEEQHILHLDPSQFPEKPTFVLIDVSFISIKPVLKYAKALVATPSIFVGLVKPQFEVGPKFLKKGVVRSEEKQREAVEDVIAFAKAEGFLYLKQTPSRLKGPKGNQEYFIHLEWRG